MNTTISSTKLGVESASPSLRAIKPRYSVQTSEREVEIRLELPGALKENISIHLEKDILRVLAKRGALLPKDAKVLHRELSTQDYELRLRLSAELDGNQMRAVLADGVLHLTLPQRESEKPRQVIIQ